MRKILSLFTMSLLITFSFGVVTQAATEGTVTATVTAQNVAVTVSDGSITYGTLALSGTANTNAGGLNDSQTATNTGNVSSDLDIKSQNGTGGTAWTLAGSIGADQYRHDFCITDCDGTPTWVAMTTVYQTLASGVAGSGTQVFDTRISIPSSSTDYVQKSVDVFVQISAA
ncbi:MAG: hypothetical protein A2406_00235 [Candidatus Komeilibacteria bacterium RIFOXYC1_FULL_37_11]|uniref:Spore coat protein U domain-containing protein n=1 Tax=Candidatus Komeilibacteria bacterium RIFOXYC1_FULL_37_11 TaxID=1798555 RepID=A0A1G2BY64_9BACT|nr:MAG: hypothetical protein A2406_00235 [Candidatus Komeilibacteria bacterium RIFOXYC1_FULL_37_11]OGY95230.1 MAG: hypothetical protein A2611_00800 [Candidatus Komeilibacteria bacterium RIFOXYD1_FULL_37_29]OGY96890.1 MAG: hypothetical protein A2543_00865 [Candidatus Komeilibacteria bacterium RIFOXYD2_FULL_37_8]